MQVTPYLNFNGDCEAAFRFYERVLGGKIEAMLTHGESPIAGEVPPAWHNRILHARLVVGDTVLMASDSPPEMYQQPQGLYVSIGLQDAADGERIFHALAEGGSVTMPFEKTFWAERFGMLVDRYGIPWMINCATAESLSDRGTSANEMAEAR
jgi:PhnB protein